ncbi:hypothetical protein IAG41_09065 [Sphingomonas sp. JC676]|uniref:hypothetical protein n=1 Tax=Sphingomonas sp. JC676 TaxID=2768065 RepID=UPI0016577557|nr:hypothetical protein [Sphingomonas sp. JC676]MBC9032540.1 hypothetical protein [Sphingomonas sp. JC676]
MKKILFLLIVLLAGLGLGGGAALATMLALGPRHETEAREAADDVKVSFVPTGKVLAPLVFADGRLAGYVQFDVELEVAQDKSAFVTERLPLLLHAINMRTYRTPMAAAPDGMLPDIEVFRKVVLQAAQEAFGAPIIRKVAVTAASPA